MSSESWRQMEYRRLGTSGLRVSAISLGTWATVGDVLDLDATVSLLETAYELGVNYFDGAETYGHGKAEELLGAALGRLHWPREHYLVSSKVYWGTGDKRPTAWGLSRKHVVEACDAALVRLGADYLDLYLCHRPDPDAPLEETARAMSDLVSAGKILYWGTSEWSPGDVLATRDLCLRLGLVGPTLEQLEYSVLARQRVEEDFAGVWAETGLGLATWGSLGHGLLAGRWGTSLPLDARPARPGYEWLRASLLGDREQERLAAAARFAALARDLGLAPAALALAWVLRNPAVSTALTGASRPEQLRENITAVRAVELVTEDVARSIDEALAPAVEGRGG